MKYALVIAFISFSQLVIGGEKTNLIVNAQEIIIEDTKLNSIIFKKLNVRAQRFDQIVGVYKLGKYIYCRTHLKKLRCYLYLSLDLDGSFSSGWSDTDFGKGDAIEFMHKRPVVAEAEYLIEGEHVFIWFEGKSAQKVFDKVPVADLSFDKLGREIRKGKHVACALDKKNRYACFLKVPLNENADLKEGPIVKWDLI